MTVVSDASPIISLARIGRLDILEQLYGTVIVPEAVWREIVVDGAGESGADTVATSDWIQSRAVVDRRFVTLLEQELGAGEAEAIALALELEAEFILMDERLAREVATHLGLRCIGVAGSLIEAKRRDVVSAVDPLLSALRSQADWRISDAFTSGYCSRRASSLTDRGPEVCEPLAVRDQRSQPSGEIAATLVGIAPAAPSRPMLALVRISPR